MKNLKLNVLNKISQMKNIELIFSIENCNIPVNTVRGGDEVVPGNDGGSADHLSISLESCQPRELSIGHSVTAHNSTVTGHLLAACWKIYNSVCDRWSL